MEKILRSLIPLGFIYNIDYNGIIVSKSIYKDLVFVITITKENPYCLQLTCYPSIASKRKHHKVPDLTFDIINYNLVEVYKEVEKCMFKYLAYNNSLMLYDKENPL